MYKLYQDRLVELMEHKGYYLLPSYPYNQSLDELDSTDELEEYCKRVLSNLDELERANTI